MSCRTGDSYVVHRGRNEHDIKAQFAAQLYTTLEMQTRSCRPSGGSLKDTLIDKEVLRMLKEYDKTGNAFRQPQ